MAYSDETKQMALMVLRNLKGNYEATARWMAKHENVDVSSDQIARWDRGEFIAPEIAENAEELKKRDLSDCLEKIAYQLVGAIPGKIPDAKLGETATTLGITIDKMLLMRGEATSITQANISREDAAIRIAEIIAKYADNTRHTGQDE